MDSSTEQPPMAGQQERKKRKSIKDGLKSMGRNFSFTRSNSSGSAASAASPRITAGIAEPASIGDSGSVAFTPRDSQDTSDPYYNPYASLKSTKEEDGSLAAQVATMAEEKKALVAANAALTAELDAVREMARELHSRATVAEESRSAASQTLLNLTQRAAVLEVEKQALYGELMKHAEGLKEAESPQRSEGTRDALEQEANEAVFSLIEELATRDAELAALRASEAALLEHLARLEARLEAELAGRDERIVELQASEAGLQQQAANVQAGHAAELATLRRNEGELLARVADLGRQAGREAAATRELEQAQGKLAAAQRGREEVLAQLAAALEARQEVQVQLAAALHAREEVQGQLAAALSAREEVQAQLTAALAGCREADGRCEAQASAHAEQLQALQAELAELRSELGAQEEQLAAHEEEAEVLSRRLAAAEAKVGVEAAARLNIDEAAREAIADLSAQLDAANAATTAAQEQVAALKRDRDVAAADRDAFQLQVSDAAAAQAAAKQQVAALQAELQAAQQLVVELQEAAGEQAPAGGSATDPGNRPGGSRMKVTPLLKWQQQPATAAAPAVMGLPPLLSAGKWVVGVGLAVMLGGVAVRAGSGGSRQPVPKKQQLSKAKPAAVALA